ncbi:hypothetical protein KY289_001391 [Solanum tuberosum]|nr:hypothetical protein KY289_001391 [Solanum tuberosum]
MVNAQEIMIQRQRLRHDTEGHAWGANSYANNPNRVEIEDEEEEELVPQQQPLSLRRRGQQQVHVVVDDKDQTWMGLELQEL